MSTPATMVTALATTVGSAAVLASVRVGWVDLVDGTVLVTSLAVLARTAIRIASDPQGTERDWS